MGAHKEVPLPVKIRDLLDKNIERNRAFTSDDLYSTRWDSEGGVDVIHIRGKIDAWVSGIVLHAHSQF